jgi:hypothetical protein
MATSVNYKESIFSGTRWRRAKQVIIENPYNAQPYVVLTEEDIIILDDNSIIHQDLPYGVERLKVPFNPATELDLINPETGLPTGIKFTHGQMYAMLASVYAAAAAERDQNIEVPAPVVLP